LVQAMVIDPLPVNAVAALVTMGSYVPKATAAVVIVQLEAIDALTAKLEFAVPAAYAGAEDIRAVPITTHRTAAVRLRLKLFTLLVLGEELLANGLGTWIFGPGTEGR
jgi:hypothetical protein